MSKRDDLLSATKKIIAENGVMGATVAVILKEAGSGYGTLYNYFPTKEDLYVEVYTKIIVDIDRYVSMKVKACTGQPLDETLKDILGHYVVYCLNHREDFYALEALRYVEDICLASKGKSIDHIGFFELIEACEAGGIIKRRPPFYNMNLMIGMVATFVRYYHQLGQEPTQDQVEDLVRSCMGALQ